MQEITVEFIYFSMYFVCLWVYMYIILVQTLDMSNHIELTHQTYL